MDRDTADDYSIFRSQITAWVHHGPVTFLHKPQSRPSPLSSWKTNGDGSELYNGPSHPHHQHDQLIKWVGNVVPTSEAFAPIPSLLRQLQSIYLNTGLLGVGNIFSPFDVDATKALRLRWTTGTASATVDFIYSHSVVEPSPNLSTPLATITHPETAQPDQSSSKRPRSSSLTETAPGTSKSRKTGKGQTGNGAGGAKGKSRRTANPDTGNAFPPTQVSANRVACYGPKYDKHQFVSCFGETFDDDTHLRESHMWDHCRQGDITLEMFDYLMCTRLKFDRDAEMQKASWQNGYVYCFNAYTSMLRKLNPLWNAPVLPDYPLLSQELQNEQKLIIEHRTYANCSERHLLEHGPDAVARRSQLEAEQRANHGRVSVRIETIPDDLGNGFLPNSDGTETDAPPSSQGAAESGYASGLPSQLLPPATRPPPDSEPAQIAPPL